MRQANQNLKYKMSKDKGVQEKAKHKSKRNKLGGYSSQNKCVSPQGSIASLSKINPSFNGAKRSSVQRDKFESIEEEQAPFVEQKSTFNRNKVRLCYPNPRHFIRGILSDDISSDNE